MAGSKKTKSSSHQPTTYVLRSKGVTSRLCAQRRRRRRLGCPFAACRLLSSYSIGSYYDLSWDDLPQSHASISGEAAAASQKVEGA